MSNIWIKICGITRNRDALSALDAGADALGMVFFPGSPRAVEPTAAAAIMAGVPDSAAIYGLFVNPSRDEVESAIASGAINCLQFHGDETEAFCSSFELPYMKAIRVESSTDVEGQVNLYASAERILLDTYSNKAPGGTGKTFDWSLATGVTPKQGQSLILAGGLNADNVQCAITMAQPDGVDVSTGVEDKPGIKNPELIRNFIREVRSV